jgi:iron complex transport system substrate-binding protein
VGEIFDRQEEAPKMINYLDEEVELVKERTRDIPNEEKPRVLYFGLVGGTSYGKGMVGLALPNYDCGTFFPDITKITNAYTGDTRALMSSEQVLAINPDVILLLCAPGGYKVSQLYDEEYYKDIQEVKAIKEKRVYSTGRLEISWNIAGLEYAIELMIEAKGAYPDRFEDVNVGEMLAEHYKELFGISDDEVKELKEIMGLDWMDEQGF